MKTDLLNAARLAYDIVSRRGLAGGDQNPKGFLDLLGSALLQYDGKPDPSHPHLIGGEFQSDKYPACPRGKVPLSVKDPTAQDLLWEYAQRRRLVDEEFAADLELALKNAGYDPAPAPPADPHDGEPDF